MRAPRLTSAAAAASRTSRCSGWRSRAPRWSRARRSPTGCAGSARRRRPRSRAARRSRSPARGRAASSSPPASTSTTSSARSPGATASPRSPTATAAAGCSRSAAPSTARSTAGAAAGRRPSALLEAAVEDFARSRPAWAAGPLTGLAELRRCQGRTQEALALLDRAGATAHLCHARIALDRGDASRAADLAERHLRKLAPERRLHQVAALDVLVRANLKGQSLDVRRAAAGGSGAAGAGRAGGRAAAGDRGSRRGHGRGARARCSRTRSTGSTRRAVRGGRRRGSRSPSCSTRPRRGPRARRGAATRSSALGTAPPLARLTPREREVLALLTEGLTQPADRRAARRERAHRPSPRHQHPAQARRADAGGGRGARRAARARIARSGDARRARAARSVGR